MFPIATMPSSLLMKKIDVVLLLKERKFEMTSAMILHNYSCLQRAAVIALLGRYGQ